MGVILYPTVTCSPVDKAFCPEVGPDPVSWTRLIGLAEQAAGVFAIGGRSLPASYDAGIGQMCLAPTTVHPVKHLVSGPKQSGPLCRADLHLVKQWGRDYRPHVQNASANPDF